MLDPGTAAKLAAAVTNWPEVTTELPTYSAALAEMLLPSRNTPAKARQTEYLHSDALGAFLLQNDDNAWPVYHWHEGIDPHDVRPGVDIYGTWLQGWHTLQSMYPAPVPGTACVVPDERLNYCTVRDPASPPYLLLWSHPCNLPADALPVLLEIARKSPGPVRFHSVFTRRDRAPFYGWGYEQRELWEVGLVFDSQGQYLPYNSKTLTAAMWTKYTSTVPHADQWAAYYGNDTWVWYCPELAARLLEQEDKREAARKKREQTIDTKIATRIYLYEITTFARDLAACIDGALAYGAGGMIPYWGRLDAGWEYLFRQFQLISKPEAYRRLPAYQAMVRKYKADQHQPSLRSKQPMMCRLLHSELRRRLPPVVNTNTTQELIDWEYLQRKWPGATKKDPASSARYVLELRNWLKLPELPDLPKTRKAAKAEVTAEQST